MHKIANHGVNLQWRAERKDAIAMKIENSAVRMDAVYSASKIALTTHTSEDLFSLAATQYGNTDLPNLPSSESGSQRYDLSHPGTLIYIPAANDTISVEESFHDLNIQLLRYLIKMMKDMLKGNNFLTQTKREYLVHADSSSFHSSQVWYRREETTNTFYSEKEAVTFDTKGMVTTSDGREISFGLSFSLSRSFMEEAHWKEVVDDVLTFYDPLVINMDVPTAAVTDQKFLFDLDQDGIEEKISLLKEGSGFLALDKNEDGRINDGSELFGTHSGDGFRDLAAYDQDQNGWIDENDSIFHKLKVWTKDRDGNDKLLSLEEADIGAIYLGHISTGFDLNDDETNETNARIQSTGIFLHESTGEAGTIQHVDFSA